MKNFILATAGHVDHGKSSLVKALTGTDPDRLPEEKSRGITIDLGFAHLELEGGYSLGLVDVPGHEDFVKNMVAGVGSVDVALLVVAADDGWMPQTEEHLQILTYLGISRGIVALTKIDLAEDEERVRAEVRSKLENSLLAEAPMVATSVNTGRGLDELKAALLELLAKTPAQADIGKPRLSVDRVFTLLGVGVVATGTLTGGAIRKGQTVLLQPGSRRARVRGIHSYNRGVEVSQPGTRTALNLSDIAVDQVSRGDVVTSEGVTNDSQTWDVILERSARANGRGIKDGATVRIHFGSANAEARVVFLDAKNLGAGERALAQLRFEEKVFAFEGDRFIVRDAAEQHTLAGGIVLAVEADRRHFHTAERREFLQARADAPNDARAFVASHLRRFGVGKRTGLLKLSRFSEVAVSAAVDELARNKAAVISGELVADAKWWAGLRERAAAKIDEAHRQRPDQPGVPINDVRAAVDCSNEVFDALLAELCNRGFAQSGTLISRKSHRLELPPALQKSAEKIRVALNAKPFDPPSAKEFAADNASQQALKFLLQTGEAMEVNKEVVMLTVAFARAREEVRKFLSERGAATAGELRQALGTSRRVIIPLLEYLDKQGVTRRDGDKRTLIP